MILSRGFSSIMSKPECRNGFKLALIQLAVSANKADNITRACQKVKEATQAGAKVVVLPECFNSPYGNAYFAEYAESIPGQSTDALAAVAKENGIYLIGGSIPERDGSEVFNTSTIYNPSGCLIAKYRKSHLFNIDIPGKITFQESKTLTQGQELVSFDTPYCRIGMGICFDMRFPQLAQRYSQSGCKLLIYPGAFNMTTGPVHWQLLARSRALDNLSYVACVSPSRDEKASYVAWGHTLAVSPWGEVMHEADETEQIVYVDIDLERLAEVRGQVPILDVQRQDLYSKDVHNVEM